MPQEVFEFWTVESWNPRNQRWHERKDCQDKTYTEEEARQRVKRLKGTGHRAVKITILREVEQ